MDSSQETEEATFYENLSSGIRRKWIPGIDGFCRHRE